MILMSMRNRCILPALLLAANALVAQTPGTHDLSFNASDLGFGQGDGPDSPVWQLDAVAIQPDGGIVIGGNFERFNNVERPKLVRLLNDGSVDMSFVPPNIGSVRDIVLQPDGKILLASGVVYRLLPDGSSDPTFSNFACCSFRRVLLQPDGHILAIAEDLPGLVRLSPNGDIDPSFNFAFPGYYTDAMALLPNGQILAAGDWFGQGTRLMRFFGDGSVDASFQSIPGPNASSIGNVLVQSDGRILVTGGFSTYHGVARSRIVRLESDGTVDLSFDAGIISTGATFNSLALRADGRILCSGNFTSIQGQWCPGFAQLLSDGVIDPSFDVGAGFAPLPPNAFGPRALAIDPTGRAVCVGPFGTYKGSVRNRLARVLSDGALDIAFHQQTGVSGSDVHDILVRSDGRIVLAGTFTAVNGKPRSGLARLLADGTLDDTFAVDSNSVTRIQRRVHEQSTGKLVAMGYLPWTSTSMMVRIEQDGSLDPGFSIGSGANDAIFDVKPHPDDKIIVGGDFTSFAGNAVGRIARLGPDGQFDPTFNTGSGFSDRVQCVLVQPDGKVLVGGNFLQFDGAGPGRLIRLNADGTRDLSFTASVFGEVRRLALRPDGRILVAHNSNRLTCLLPSGALDPTFNNGFTVDGSSISGIAVLTTGGIVLTGNFIGIGGMLSSGIALLTPNGQPDPAFEPGEGLTNTYSGFPVVGVCVTVQDDGRILVGGQFTAYDGTGRNRIARIFAGLSVGMAERPGTQQPWLYPNPTDGMLMVQVGEMDLTPGVLRVRCMDGRVVLEQRMSAPNTALDVQHVAAGTYTVELIDTQQQRMMQRFIKQ